MNRIFKMSYLERMMETVIITILICITIPFVAAILSISIIMKTIFGMLAN